VGLLHPLQTRPQVVQYGGCGTRGRAVLMPYNMLINNVTIDMGKIQCNQLFFL
jgi:hypothetical protein